MLGITLAGVAATVLTEGVKFLYGQASALLTEWRARKHAKADSDSQGASSESAAPVNIFTGEVRLANPDFAVMDRREQALEELLLTGTLVRIGNLGQEADPQDQAQVEAAEALRAVMEEIYGVTITLIGEEGRPPSGSPVVRGEAEAKIVDGLLAGVRVRNVKDGLVVGTAKAHHVQEKGSTIGVEITGDVGA